MDGWDFKQFVLGALFYRFISENLTNYIEAGDDSISYAAMSDTDIPDEAMIDAVKTKGYCIYPSQLFSNVVAAANTNESLNTKLDGIFKKIEASANGYPSEKDIKGLFADFDTTSNRLGSTVKEKNTRLHSTHPIKNVHVEKMGQPNLQQAIPVHEEPYQASTLRALQQHTLCLMAHNPVQRQQ